MSWRKQPISVDKVSGVDCVVAIDENGTVELKNSQDKLNRKEMHRWFTVTGVLISAESFDEIRQGIIDIKNKYWKDGKYKNKRVVFHSKDIRKKQNAFSHYELQNYDRFTEDLRNCILNSNVTLYSSCIDKFAHVDKYLWPHPVYNLSMKFVMERMCNDLTRNENTGVILLESRGKREDIELHNFLMKLLNNGTEYCEKEKFNCIKGVFFNKKNTADGNMSYWPLELADLYSYPIHSVVKDKEKLELYKPYTTKIKGYPFYKGTGLKIFP